MAKKFFHLFFIGFILEWFRGDCIILVIPEDVPAGFAAIYGFSPRLMIGKDHRFGFGFRFGNHADFQVMYELGPQTITRPLQPVAYKTRSAAYRQSEVKRRPLLQFLINLGLVKQVSYNYNVDDDNEVDNEPR
ncbi:uncharacterized protein LOC128681769 isoform X1 [Plodia interpunctella]|uniref:uncharacterized protein LOC128681769 isoform X1 n=1 Tax=Plodia interpunctella TaxID=58824 RepID=UPI00236772C9|nr:uncharacterized protein LOC128681769 isoform X1 [Plodia interpunctella]